MLKREPIGFPFTLLAESEGFKPPIPERGIPDFESSAIDHSANSPLADAKVVKLFEIAKLLRIFFAFEINIRTFAS